MAARKNTPIYVAAFVLFAAGLGWLVYSGLSSGSVYFVNVSEALAMEPGKLTQARLFGTVLPEGLTPAAGGLGARFTLADKDNPAVTVPVDYRGALPDTFKPGVEVIVEGGLDPAAHVFKAATLMTKCPSKYQKQRDEEKAARAAKS